ncbi:transposase [Okeania sp. KiyG1]|uniref:transposase n=1 Tax=Okeania sp. KiyG1 TaxID=2720165 RepID=UPI00192406EE|nr:transposase [Okeania sp. KiyG1]GGA32471.1 hypothetical protein CYANOKiyG1_49310 [Okeania sp. KiyG1]
MQKSNSNEVHIIQLDNGALHKALTLNIPENIVLLFQPTYSPQVNPIERLWQYIKEDFKWINFGSIEDLQNALTKSLNKLTQKVIARITGWEFIVDAL